jgi:hypothetical protein
MLAPPLVAERAGREPRPPPPRRPGELRDQPEREEQLVLVAAGAAYGNVLTAAGDLFTDVSERGWLQSRVLRQQEVSLGQGASAPIGITRIPSGRTYP